ncbi:glycosyltransferase [Jiella endophytica]|uniref:Glycosyltransferase n=1 Tax=Jiella endophytica TaxID=2558362 RepID=A0A4Y8RNZ7_9HYPH|nr:glycosyltransferase [Jiella endophytica]TFF25066.1 glycosyltransferase [Jiella endophytica]
MSKISSSSIERLFRSFRDREEGKDTLAKAFSRTTALLNGTRSLIKAGDKANAERRWNDAQDAYSEALRRSPKLATVWVQYGHALKEQGFTGRAEDAYRQAIKLRGDIADTHLQLGHALKLQGKRSDAITAYRRAYILDPTLSHAVTELKGMAAPVPTETEIADFYDDNPDIDARAMTALSSAEKRLPGNALERFLSEQGISLSLAEKFDAEYYYFSTRSLRSQQPTFDREAAFRHFVSTGIEELAPIRAGYEFDADFYVDTYGRDLESSSPVDAYRHYLRTGIDSHQWPNRRIWLESLLGHGVRSLATLDLPVFAGAESQESFTDRFMLLMTELASKNVTPVVIEPQHVRLMTMIADRLVLEGKDAPAVIVYQKVLRVAPDFAQAQRHYADALVRRKCFREAAAIYERLVAAGDANIWTYINLAQCADQTGDQPAALHWLKQGIDRFPADLGIRRRFNDLAPRFLTSSWLLARAEASEGRLADAIQRIQNDCDLVFELMHARTAAEKRFVRAVALVGNFDLPQCRFYRIDQKIEQLEAAGFVVETFDFKKDIDTYLLKVHCFDAAIFFRVPAYYEVVRAIDKARETGCATFYEIDDLIFDGDFFPPPLETYGGQITAKEHDGLALGVPLFRSALKYSENALVSTRPLVEHVKRLDPGKPTFVHANALHSPHEKHFGTEPSKGDKDRVTIFYGSGTKAHKQDFQELVEPALAAMADKYGDRISIVLAGYMTPGPVLRQFEDRLVMLPPVWDVHEYWSTLAAADINLAVLHPSPATDVKSEIKWLEAAMLGIPSVISETALYADLIEDGVDGILARSPDEWTDALDRLIGDAELRRRIGSSAREKALRNYSVPAMAENITSIIRSASRPVPDTRKRVLIVNVFYPPQAIGGATRVVHDNVRHYAAHHRDEFSFEVFCSIEGGSEPYKTSAHAADSVRVVGVTTPHQPDLDQIVHDEKMGKVFADYLDVVKPDIIHFHCVQRLTAAVVLEARRRRIPYVLTVHDGWWISDEQFLLGKDGKIVLYDHANPASQLGRVPAEQFAARMQLRECLFGAEKVMAVSESFAKIHRDVGVPNVIAVPNGGSEMQPLPRVPSPDGKVRLGFIGGLARHKGYHLIPQALINGEFENLRFVLIDHAMAAGTHRRDTLGTTELDIRPKVQQSKVAELYAELDVLVAPSVWPEAYGLVTREALLCGCWVVASDRGAVGEDVIDGVNGFKVDVSSSEGLLQALKEIDRNPERYLKSPAPTATLRRASEQAEELIGIYRDVLSGRDARGSDDPERRIRTAPGPASVKSDAEPSRIRQILPN